MAEWLHGKKFGLRQASSTLRLWVGIETIIWGAERVSMIASIAAILEAADKSWIRRELYYMASQQNGDSTTPYEPPSTSMCDILVCIVKRLHQ